MERASNKLPIVVFALQFTACIVASNLFGKVAPAYGRIEGTVVDSATSIAIPFASVCIGDSGKCTETEVDGCFRLSQVTAGTYELKVSAVGYPVTRLGSVSLSPNSTIWLSVTLAANSRLQASDVGHSEPQEIIRSKHYVLEGVVAESGKQKPIAYAGIEFVESCRNVSSNEQGYFRLDYMKEGEYTAIISAAGYISENEKVRLGGRDTTELAVSLTPLLGKPADTSDVLPTTIEWSGVITKTDSSEIGVISGTVADRKTGTPVVGASVRIAGTKTGAMTDTDGRYNIRRVDPGLYTLQVTSVGHKYITVRQVRVETGSTTSCSVSLDSARIFPSYIRPNPR